jgi:hypothetical protein
MINEYINDVLYVIKTKEIIHFYNIIYYTIIFYKNINWKNVLFLQITIIKELIIYLPTLIFYVISFVIILKQI